MTGRHDDRYDEAVQKRRKDKMDSCDDDTLSKYRVYIAIALSFAARTVTVYANQVA
jgi:hypothetical protein